MKYDVMPIYISKDGEWYAGEMLKDINIYSDPDLLKREVDVKFVKGEESEEREGEEHEEVDDLVRGYAQQG